jgi:hypothetical protein
MKSKFILVFLATFGLIITSCSKSGSSSSTPPQFTAVQADLVQNSDVQEAIADKTDDAIDNSISQLQANNYQTGTPKSLSTSGGLVITVDHPDSTTFPKVITFVFSNFQDSTFDESFVLNGEVDITVTSAGNNYQLITWDQLFKNFSVTTDSTVFTVSGTRTIARVGHNLSFRGLQGLRVSNTDNITGSLSYSITKIGASDSLKFTRVVSRVRNAILYFDNLGGITWRTAFFRYNLDKDTITWTGTVSGINEAGNPYTRTVGSANPLIVTFYFRTPIISSGVMTEEISGSSPASYTITFKQDPEHPRFTLVTVTNNATQAKFSFDRIFGRKLRRWW